MKDLTLIKTEVGGIQRFIGAPGKLKEMIGGSEIIYHICQEDFYKEILAAIGCQSSREEPGQDDAWHILVQNNAGALCLILPCPEKGRQFLRQYSQKVLEEFPGLPVFGAQWLFDWNDRDSYLRARSDCDREIGDQRASCPVAGGISMLPILRAARLDGLPAVAEEKGEYISLLSQTRRNARMLKDSAERLRKLAPAPEGIDVQWINDLEELLPQGGKVALIHMDGNDLGKLFKDRLEKNFKDSGQNAAKKPLKESIRDMRSLSESIAKANNEAFAYAAQQIKRYLKEDERSDKADLVMPLRPLVLGGDDITVIARADIALAFVSLFARRFEELGRENGLSLGIGMLVMDSSYPFAKAFKMVESLLERAKKATLDMDPRPSSLDYIVMTGELENSEDIARARIYKGKGGEWLTGKPLILDKPDSLSGFLEEGLDVLHDLPRSQMRQALAACREGEKATHLWYENMLENLARGLGGRHGEKLMTRERFEKIFPGSFFREVNGRQETRLGDYLELGHLLPADKEDAQALLDLIAGKEDRNV